jgi:Lrp/AsnC family transcriptional regulator, leucine-responsive regulatory protein
LAFGWIPNRTRGERDDGCDTILPPISRRRERSRRVERSLPASATGHNRPTGDEPLPHPRAPYHAGVLDERDLAIIAALQEDARATYADVGRRVGLSPSSVHDRVRKLEQASVIRGYRAVVDPESMGLFVTALIAVTPLDPMQPDDLPDRVRGFGEVEDCLSVAGEANYILKVRTRTTSHLEDLIRRLREKGGVQTRTTIVLSTPFEGRAVTP